MQLFVVLILICSTASLTSSINVLAYIPMFGKSHVRFLSRIAQILIEAGHNVVHKLVEQCRAAKKSNSQVFCTVIAPNIDDTDSIDIPREAETIFIGRTPEKEKEMEHFHGTERESFWTKDSHPLKLIPLLRNMAQIFADQCKVTLESGVIEQLSSRHFDIAYSEGFDDCGFAIFHLLGVETYVTTYSTFTVDGASDMFGTPGTPSYVPTLIGAYGDEMNFVQRTQNALSWILATVLSHLMTSIQDQTYAMYGVPSARLLIARSSFIFTNSEPLIDFPKPTNHRIVEIGGISLALGARALNKTWSSLLSERKYAVLISFGTIALSAHMPYKYKQSILAAAAGLPDTTFIWKYERPEDFTPDQLPENVRLSTWVPQNDLLNDASLSAFVTHAGAGSCIETSNAGVPSIAIPFMADQYRNAQMLKRIGTAIVLEKGAIANSKVLMDMIHEILTNPAYKEKSLKIRKMIRNQPFSAREKLLNNFEFAAKFGPLTELQHYGTQLWFWQYYLLDVTAFLFLVFSMTTYLTFTIFCFLFRRSCVNTKNNSRHIYEKCEIK